MVSGDKNERGLPKHDLGSTGHAAVRDESDAFRSDSKDSDPYGKETMRTDVLNADSFGDGAIGIEDTASQDAAAHVQKAVDAIGRLGADLCVIGIVDLRAPDKHWKRRVPDKLAMYEKPIDGHERRMDDGRRAGSFSIAVMGRKCPINCNTTAELFMSYRQDADGKIVVDETDRSSYYGVMRYDEADRDGLLTEPDAPIARPGSTGTADTPRRDPYLLALWDRTSGLVMPLPLRSLLLYRFWKSGMGVDLYVVDGESLRIQRRNHPECFDESADERLVQREIDECEAELAHVIKNNINLRQHPDAYRNARGKERL